MKFRLISLLVCLVVILAGCNLRKRKHITLRQRQRGTYYPIGIGMGQLWTKHYRSQNTKFNGQSSAGSVKILI